MFSWLKGYHKQQGYRLNPKEWYKTKNEEIIKKSNQKPCLNEIHKSNHIFMC